MKTQICIFIQKRGKFPATKLEATEEYPSNKLIVYLDSFDEYTEYEQKMLNSIVEKSEIKQKRIEAVGDYFDSLNNWLERAVEIE